MPTRPRGPSDSCSDSTYVGHDVRHSPQRMQASMLSYSAPSIAWSVRKAGGGATLSLLPTCLSFRTNRETSSCRREIPRRLGMTRDGYAVGSQYARGWFIRPGRYVRGQRAHRRAARTTAPRARAARLLAHEHVVRDVDEVDAERIRACRDLQEPILLVRPGLRQSGGARYPRTGPGPRGSRTTAT